MCARLSDGTSRARGRATLSNIHAAASSLARGRDAPPRHLLSLTPVENPQKLKAFEEPSPPGEQPGEAARVLRLSDLLRRRRGTLPQQIIHVLLSLALRLFFRRVETSGAGRVPPSGPLVFVLNHPNGLIDPALVFCALPRRVSFLAKSTLFRLPLVGFLVRAMEALPLYRRSDPGEDVSRNLLTFRACRELLARGRCIALFPEGVSHDSTKLLPVKTGAARIALGALSVKGDGLRPDHEAGARGRTLLVMPVGLYYTSKTSFRSEALIRFGPPLEVRPVALDEAGEPPREEVQTLSRRIEEALRGVTLNAEGDEELEEVKRAEQLFSSIYEGINSRRPLAETFSLLRRLAESLRLVRAHSPGQVARLRRRIARYEKKLRDVGIAPGALSVSAYPGWYVARHLVWRIVLLALLLPLTTVGAATHLPAFGLSQLLAWRFRRHGPDSIGPTVKILAAILLMPLTWLVVSASLALRFDWRIGLAAFPLSIICGYAALRSLEELAELRGWLKAVLVLLRRRGLFLRLLFERRALHEEIGWLVGDGQR